MQESTEGTDQKRRASEVAQVSSWKLQRKSISAIVSAGSCPMPRLSKYTRERAAKVIAGLRAGMTRTAACGHAGICYDAFLSWGRRKVDFWAEVELREFIVRIERSRQLPGMAEGNYSLSNPWLVNLSVRLFSVTVRTTFSGTPPGISASISSVTRTDDPTHPTRCVMTSSAIRLPPRPGGPGWSVTVP